jgi:NDP-sugar pyrophosphorylase family protein
MEAFRDRSSIPFELFDESERIRGTGGALYFARDFLGTSELVCVCNAEPLTVCDLRQLRQSFESLSCDCGLVAAASEGVGTLLYDPCTLDYAGTRAETCDTRGLASADFVCIAFYRRRFLDILHAGDFSIAPVWKRAQRNGLTVKVLKMHDIYWRDIGTPGDVRRIHFDILDGASPIEPAEGYVVDHKRKIAYRASLAEPEVACLGPYSWYDAVSVPYGCRIERSIVFAGAALTAGQHIADAIVTQWGSIAHDNRSN